MRYPQARSKERFGRRVRVLSEPHQQMMGSLVAEVCVIRAPDSVRIELLRKAGRLGHAMQADWSLGRKLQ